jgi:hypothetical protein
MFAFINGMPMAPLDAGVVFNAVLDAFHSRLSWRGRGTPRGRFGSH